MVLHFLDKIKIENKVVVVRPLWNDPNDYELINDEKGRSVMGTILRNHYLKANFSGRDGIIKYDVSEIEKERRSNYKWHGDWCVGTFKKYEKWVSKNG